MMQQSLKQNTITGLIGLFITLASSFNFLAANAPGIPPVVKTDTSTTNLASCDSLYLPETDSTYFASTTVEIIGSRTTLVDTTSNDTTYLDLLQIFNIEILHPTFDTTRVDICDNGQGVLFADSVFTESTVFTQLYQSEMGCDSSVTLVLTVHPTYETRDTLNVTICENELPFIFGNDSIYTEGAHNLSVQSAFGCDSLILTVNLTLTANPKDSVYRTLCSNLFPYDYNEHHSFDAPGIYDIVNDDTLACHKITTLFLTSVPAYDDTLNVSICDIDTPYVFADTSFSTSTTYTIRNETEHDGCDSLTTLVLNVFPTRHDTITVRQYTCRYDLPFIYADSALTETGEYGFQTQSVNGCDSSYVIISFQVLENLFDTLNVSLCSNEFPFVYDSLHVFDSAGTYTFLHLEGARQCPDVTTLHLSSRPSYNDTTVVTICSTEAPFVFADSNFVESTVYTIHDTSVLGCDSLSTLILTVNQAYSGVDTLEMPVCSIDLPFIYNGDTLTEPGIYNFHLTTEAGCDSTDMTIHFSILETPYDTVSVNVCSNDFPLFYYGNQIDSAGEYNVRIPDTMLCDTMRHLFVHETPIYHDSIQVMVCSNDSFQIGDTTLVDPGIYDIMLQTVSGCDSLVTVTLGHYPTYRDSIQSFTICENDLPFIYDGIEYNETDTITRAYQTVNGCDSIVTFSLTVVPIIYNQDTLQHEICRSELPYLAFGRTLEEAGIYTYTTVSTVTGCDSVFYLRLIVHDNPAPTISGSDYLCEGSVNYLSVEQDMTEYVWNNGNINQQITIEAPGTFTVTVTNEFGCTNKATKTVTAAALPNIIINGTSSICYGDSSTITVSGADHYVWDNGIQNATINVHPTTTTAYNVTAYSELQCARNGSFTVVVNTLPVPIITGTASVCAGDSTQFIAGGGLQYQWSTGHTTNRINVSEAGIYRVTVTDANGCKNSASQVLTVNSRPNIRINGRTTFCQGSTTTISAGGATTYEWNSGELTASISTAYAGTYTVTGTAANGCTSTASVTLITSQIQATITGERHFCQGESTTLSVAGNETYTYRWADGSTTSSISVSAAGSYSVEVTNALGCTNTISATVTEYALPNPTITTSTGSNTICAGRSTILRATGGNRYLWEDGSTQAFINVNTTGTYEVTVTNQQGCSASTSTTIIVNPLPEVNILTNGNICSGESTTITVHSPSAVSYSWATGQNTSIVTVTPTATTSYTVLVTDENNCTSTASTTITVNERPVPYINGDLNICQGSSTTLTAFGGNMYQWSNGTIAQSITVSSAGTYTVTVSSAASSACSATATAMITVNPQPIASITESTEICRGQSVTLEVTTTNCTYEWSNGGRNNNISVRNEGTYTVTITNTTTGCSKVLSTSLVVNELPQVSIAGSTIICQGDNTTLTATSPENCNFQWNNGPNNALFNVSAGGTYTVTATNLHQCSNSASVLVSVNPLPTPTISGANTVCPNGTATLTASPAVSYLWSTGDENRSIAVNPNASTSYSVTVTDNNGCHGSTEKIISISEVPEFIITGTTSICSGQSTQLTANGDFSYRWSNNSNNASITITAPGSYSVTATNSLGCTRTKTVDVVVNPVPVVQINGSTSYCAGGSTLLTANSSSNCTYIWNNSTENNSIVVTTPGTYRVTATNNGNNCIGTAVVHVTELANPTPQISGIMNICPGTSTELTSSSAAHFQWSTNDTTQSITISPTHNSSYTVTVTDNNGCQGSQTVLVQLYAPPVFNINGPATICANEPTSLSVPANFEQYVWSTGSTSSSITVTATGIYSVTVTDQNNCQAQDSKSVTVKELPVISFNGTTDICEGESTAITAIANEGSSYRWSDGQSTPVANFNSAGIYTVTATLNGCSNNNAIVIRQYANPVPVISGAPTICRNSTGILISIDAAHYSWSTGDTTRSITVSPTSSSTYNLTVTDIHGCQGNTSFAMNISEYPTVNISGNTNLCVGTSTTLSATQGYQYLWSTNDTSRSIQVSTAGIYRVTATNVTGCSTTDSVLVSVNELPVLTFGASHSICLGNSYTYELPTDNNITYTWSNGAIGNTVTVTSADIYTVTATNQYGCSRSASDSLYVRPLPVPSITGGSTICQGNNALLTAHGGVSYHWSNGSTTTDIAVFPNTTTTYAVTATNEYGCSASTSTVVNVNVLPSISFIGNRYFCEGNSTNISVMGGTSYNWSTGDHSNNISIGVAGTYRVTVTNTLGCQRSDSISITARPNPVMTVTGDNPLCEGESETLTAIGADSYSWNTGENSNSIMVMPTTTTTYTVSGSDLLGCTSVVSKVVSVEALPDLHVSGISTICNGETATLTASGANTFLWNNGSTSSSIMVNQGGTYTVTGSSANGCHNSASITVTINPTPIANLNGSNTICENSTLQLTATGGDAYSWNTGATSNAITISTGGAYSVTVTNTYGCSSSANINVSTLASPFLQIIGNTSTCSGSEMQLIASTNGNYYSWNTGSNTQSISVAPTASQYFKVTVTNALGCTASDSIYVTVHPTYNDTISRSVCQGQPFNQNGFSLPIQNEAGEFYHTQHLYSSLGCDSIVTLRLTVNPLPIIDTITGATLISFTGSQIYTVPNPQYTNIFEWRLSNTTWSLTNNLNSAQVNFTGAGSGTLTAKAINECGFTEKSILITCNVGVEEYDNDTHIRLYPNPVHTTLHIDLTESQLSVDKVQLYDNLGRCVLTIPANAPLMQLDCSEFASGVYYVKFINNEYQLLETRKIIIK